jgi:hypothetical protein
MALYIWHPDHLSAPHTFFLNLTLVKMNLLWQLEALIDVEAIMN